MVSDREKRVRLHEVAERASLAARRAAGREARLAAVNRAQRANRRRFVLRHTGAQQSGNRNGRDDADDRDDQQLLTSFVNWRLRQIVS